MKLVEQKIYLFGDDIFIENSKGEGYIYNKPSKKWIISEIYRDIFRKHPSMKPIAEVMTPSVLKYIITNVLTIRVKSCELSAKVFGFKKYKEALVGTKTNNYSFEGFINKEKKDYSGGVFKIYNKEEETYLSFCEEDLEFCIPNFDSYTAPKDKTVRNGVVIKPKSEKHIKGYKGIEIDGRYAICNILSYNPHTKKPSVVEVMNKDMVKSKVRVKHFKVI